MYSLVIHNRLALLSTASHASHPTAQERLQVHDETSSFGARPLYTGCTPALVLSVSKDAPTERRRETACIEYVLELNR